jgi:putative Ca2+/H+ antiporter (TMEM165/GDT1 family)
MAFGDDVPADVKKKRTKLALLSFSGDIVVAMVFLVFMAQEIGDMAYLVTAVLIASGAAFLYVFPRLPVGKSSGASPTMDQERK